MLKKLIKWCLGLSTANQSINLYKTLIFNFMAFGLKGILNLPVYIYSNTKIYSIGKIRIHCPIKRGIVKIGQLDYKSQGETRFRNSGVIDIYGFCEIGGCTILDVSGNLIIHNAVRIADGCLVVVRRLLEIKEQTRIGFHCFILDSDDHYTVHVDSLKINDNSKPIIIGAYNWIGSKTSIMKNVQTTDFTIVSSMSHLIKDYSDLPPYTVLGGSPAKVIKSGLIRVFDPNHEVEIRKSFKEQKDSVYSVVLDDNQTLIDFCKLKSNTFLP